MTKKLYIMILSGLPEYEDKTYYEIREDRPWTKEELWGFSQLIIDLDKGVVVKDAEEEGENDVK